MSESTRTALVLGATGGIGDETALALARMAGRSARSAGAQAPPLTRRDGTG